MTNVIQIGLFTASLLGIVCSVVAYFLLRAMQKKSAAAKFANRPFPAVTILKPLKGVDEDLERNLRSFFVLEYPGYELIFGVEDPADPAIAIVNKLRREFPKRSAKLVVNSARFGQNPKVNNLINLSRIAAHDFWVISDSNTRVETGYLNDLVSNMDSERVGLVTSAILGVGGKSLGARLENLHLNTLILSATLVVNKLSSIPVSIGKSMLLRRRTVEQLGGFEAFANYLLEDALLGQRIRALGLETRITVRPVHNLNTGNSVGQFVSRHFRWGVGRFWLNPASYLGEMFSNTTVLALAALLIGITPTSLICAAAILLSKVLIDLQVCRTIGGRSGIVEHLLLPVKDSIIGAVWFAPFFTNRVNWRGNSIKVGRLSKATLLKPADRYSSAPDSVKRDSRDHIIPIMIEPMPQVSGWE